MEIQITKNIKAVIEKTRVNEIYQPKEESWYNVDVYDGDYNILSTVVTSKDEDTFKSLDKFIAYLKENIIFIPLDEYKNRQFTHFIGYDVVRQLIKDDDRTIDIKDNYYYFIITIIDADANYHFVIQQFNEGMLQFYDFEIPKEEVEKQVYITVAFLKKYMKNPTSEHNIPLFNIIKDETSN